MYISILYIAPLVLRLVYFLRRSMETNKIAKLRASLHFLETNNEEEEPQNSHILFVETAEEGKICIGTEVVSK